MLFTEIHSGTFDEGAGAIAYDYSGNNATGTLFNSPTWAAGVINGAITFNGSNQRVTATSGLTSSTKIFTISLWLKSTSNTPSAEPLSIGGQLDLETEYSTNVGAWQLNGGAQTTFSLPHDGAWRMLTLVNNGSAQSIYVNGAFATSSAATPTLSGTISITMGSGSGGTFSFAGTLDDVRVYNRALTAAQVLALYNGDK